MKHLYSALGALALALGLVSGAAARPVGAHRGGGFHGGGFHRPFFHGHRGTRVFIGGSLFFDPFLYPYYPAPYPYPVYVYPPPPPPEEPAGAPPEGTEAGTAPEGTEEQRADTEAATRRATYGLVQLRGVPDGAAVDLDGRFWLTADALDDRWLALPDGRHTITVRVQDFAPAERRVDVKPGTTHVVRFGPFRAGGARG